MPLSFDRANLPGSGAPKITFDGATLWTRGDVVIPLAQNLVERVASMYGRVGKTRGPRKIEFSIPVYGFWDNLSVLFPSYFLNFTHGARIFGTTDKPFVLLARNGDQLTIHNARITGLANLKLAANQEIFSGDLTFTALIKNNTAPTNAAAYYTIATGASYTEGDFPRATHKSLAWTGAWGARTGFTSILTEAGWDVNWEVGVTDDLVDGIGAVDQFVNNCWAAASCIPVGPTLAQIESNQNFQDANADIGADLGGDVDDLVLTDGTSSLTLYSAALVSDEFVFAPFRKRKGTLAWEIGTREFTTGAPTALAAVA
jgi:hypothetical protein